MPILLAGDIGGTKTILQLVRSQVAETAESFIPTLTVLFEASYASQDYPDLVPIVQKFLGLAATQLGQSILPEGACFGIAGPVVDNRSDLTNLSWSLSAERLQRELDIPRIRLINDFVAVGYGILGLTPQDLETLQAVSADLAAPIAVIGAGTGLGEGFLVPASRGRYRIYASEGSHADFAPRSELEFELLGYLRELHDINRVSVERVVSGMGIAAIYQFLRDREVSKESPRLAAVYRTWKQEIGKPEKTVDLAAEVSRAAIAGQDFLCEQAMRLFVEAYGAEAGNLALKLLPYGGLYLAGGISPKILPLIRQGHFMKAFVSKGRVSTLLEKIPVHIVLNPKVGLIGAALCAAQIDLD